LRLLRQRPSDVERLILLLDDVIDEERKKAAVDPLVSPQEKQIAATVYDTIKMNLVGRVVKQAHGKQSPLKSKTTETEKTKVTETG
jgi:hypothetical protein